MIQRFQGKIPDAAHAAFIASGATVIGDVVCGTDSSIWYSAVVRGDMAAIRIGERSNVQDCAVLHTDPGQDLVIGDDVTIGHGAVVHGAYVGDGALIGMQATILTGARIGRGAVIGAGALVKEGQEIGDGELAVGVPAKVIRKLDDGRIRQNIEHAHEYAEIARQHAHEQPAFRVD